MWIERLQVAGFRCLRGEFEFSRGLTVVTGPNESGKSSLHELVMRSLFGFSSRERRRTGGESHKDRCRPWNGSAFGVTAVVRDVRGRSLEVVWDFEEHDLKLLDQDTREDLTQRVMGKRQDVTLGKFMLGIELDEFKDVCCLHQRAIEPVRGSEPLRVLLQKAVESGIAEGGAEDADARLAGFLRDRLGVHSGHYTPLSGRALDSLKAKRNDLSAALDRATEGREEISKLAVQHAEKQEQRRNAVLRLEQARQALYLTELSELEAKLRRARDLAGRAADRPETPVVVPAGASRVRELRQRIDRLDREISGLEPQAHAREKELGPPRGRVLELNREADALAAYRDVDDSCEERVRELVGQLEAADPGDAPAEARRDPQLARFRTERTRLLELAGGKTAQHPSRARLILAGAIAAVSVVLGASVHPIAFAGVAVAVAVLLASRVRDRDVRGELDDVLRELGAASLQELEARAEQEDREIAAIEEQVRRWQSDVEERQRVEEELGRCLEETGAPPAPQPVDRARAYLKACERRRRLLQIDAELGRLSAAIAEKETLSRDLERRRADLEEAQRELAAAYAGLGIDAATLAEAGTLFDRQAEQAEADREKIALAENAARELDGLLEGSSMDALERRLEQARQRHREHQARHGRLIEKPGDVEELRRSVETVGGDVRDLETDCKSIAARIDEREQQLPDVAELRRQLDEVTAEIARSERAAQAVKIARDTLAEAARQSHRAFAPHLEAALKRTLPRITAGRYSTVKIDDQLQIEVVPPELDTLVPAELLSRGTQDQIFLLERLEIARLLDPTTGEAPLLLDDPFDHFDDSRLLRGLEMLAEVAEQRQVVLLVEESHVVRQIREVVGECQIIELPAPQATGAVAV